MKIAYIVLVLALIPSSLLAQDKTSTVDLVELKGVKINEEIKVEIKKDNLLDVNQFKNQIVKNSDIRTYFNIIRRRSNIGVIFPKIGRPVKV